MNDNTAPYSAAAERNAPHILQVLGDHLGAGDKVLEVGSGTGQHGVHFARALSGIQWQCSDRAEYLQGIRQTLSWARLSNTPAPIQLDVNGPWPSGHWDCVYSANTLHIMAWSEVERMFQALPGVLRAEGKLCIYGPFQRGGAHTSTSNAQFDLQLRAHAPHQGVRDLEAVHALAEAAGLRCIDDRALPANNACLVWQRTARAQSA